MKPTVLILDPTTVGRTIAKTACDQLGCVAHTAISGRSGLEACQDLSPHVVILDCGLTDLSADTFSRQLTKLQVQRFPAFIITGDNVSAVLSAYHKIALAQDYLRKPFQINTLRAVLEKTIDFVTSNTVPLPGMERRKKLSQMRRMEADLVNNPDVQQHLALAHDFLQFQMTKDASRHLYAAALLENPPNRIPILAGILKPNHRLSTVLQVITSHRLTGNLVLELGNGGPSYIYFEDGQILDAVGPGTAGRRCIYTCLACMQGEYSFFEMPMYHNDNIKQTTEELLLDFASRWDEGRHEEGRD